MASQTITGPDLQYTQDNQHAFAYSGSTDTILNTDTQALLFTTGSGYLVGHYNFNSDSATGNDLAFKIFFNDIQVVGIYDRASQQQPPFPKPLIIPPFTKVEFTVKNIDSTSVTIPCFAAFTGRVHEYLPVRN